MINTVRVSDDHGRDFHPLAAYKTAYKSYTNMLQWILNRLDFSQNEFEMRLAKNVIKMEHFNKLCDFNTTTRVPLSSSSTAAWPGHIAAARTAEQSATTPSS